MKSEKNYDVRQLLIDYQLLFPAEEQQGIETFIQKHKGTDLYDRKNFEGHITASGLILDNERKNILLLHHKFLKIELSPGGHVDSTDESILDGAYREIREEAGIAEKELQLLPLSADMHVPFDINSHEIPANPKKNEPAHIHHDFRYLFIFLSDRKVVFDPEESTGMTWLPLEDLHTKKGYESVIRKFATLPLMR